MNQAPADANDEHREQDDCYSTIDSWLDRWVLSRGGICEPFVVAGIARPKLDLLDGVKRVVLISGSDIVDLAWLDQMILPICIRSLHVSGARDDLCPKNLSVRASTSHRPRHPDR